MSLRDGYGAIPTSHNHDAGFVDAVDQERANLLNSGKAKSSRLTRFQSHMTSNVSRAWADLALLACYVVTGLLDSSSVFIFGAFVSMQTGMAPVRMLPLRLPLPSPTRHRTLTDSLYQQETPFT